MQAVDSHPFIRLVGVTFAYSLPGGGHIAALSGVDLAIGRGEFVAIVGPNGSGKSTLARHLNGLLLPTAGEVWVDGERTTSPGALWRIRRKVGYVAQNPESQLVASTVEEDVAFGPENHGLAPDEIRRRVDEALAIVGLGAYRVQPPFMLSGGQKQRLAIAGALALRPQGIVLDEPTSMLDPRGRQEVLAAIRKLHCEHAMTVVLITHSMAEAALARRVIALDAGRIVLDGRPEEVFEQAEALAALGLGLPPVAAMAHVLRQRGLGLPTWLHTPEQLVAALC